MSEKEKQLAFEKEWHYDTFTQYRLTWRFADEGVKQSSIFWLPKDKDPNQYISDILNIVELSASEYGYKYTLEIVNKTGEL